MSSASLAQDASIRFNRALAFRMKGEAMLQTVVALFLACLALVPRQAVADGVSIDSREYKLSLNSEQFAGQAPKELADRLWEQVLKPAIAKRLDARENGEPRYKKAFKLTETRAVRFWDTNACLLRRNDFALRERVDLVSGQEKISQRKVTLKLRSPDLFRAAGTRIGAGSGKVKLEEDIGPLLARGKAANGAEMSVVEPRSMRSLFSTSVTQAAAGDVAFRSLADVLRLYPNLKQELTENTGDADPQAQLEHGRTEYEIVFEKAEVDLGDTITAEFALTLWFATPEASASPPDVAEISFAYKTDGGKVSSAVTQRAKNLYIGLQDDLGDWLDRKPGTKTEQALPEACKR
jgi:hypothetical protein